MNNNETGKQATKLNLSIRPQRPKLTTTAENLEGKAVRVAVVTGI